MRVTAHFFVANTFQARDYERFGIDTLKNHGVNVYIWDLTPVVAPLHYAQSAAENDFKVDNYKVFKNLGEIKNAVQQLPDTEPIVLFFAPSKNTIPVFEILSKARCRIGTVALGCIPSPLMDKRSITARLGSALKNPMKVVDKIRDLVPIKLNNIRPFDFIILGGVKSKDTILHINNNTDLLWCHSMDYDIFQMDRNESKSEQHIAFLDVYYPFHPDFKYNNLKFPATPDEYYKPLCNFFDYIEDKFNKPVIIAAHPRSDYSSHPDYFSGRRIIKGKTAELVRNASLVLSDVSTSLNFVVLYKKPLLLLSHSFLNGTTEGGYTKGISRALQKNIIYVDRIDNNYTDIDVNLDVNELIYNEYVHNYIKKNDTSEQLIWKTVAEYLTRKRLTHDEYR